MKISHPFWSTASSSQDVYGSSSSSASSRRIKPVTTTNDGDDDEDDSDLDATQKYNKPHRQRQRRQRRTTTGTTSHHHSSSSVAHYVWLGICLTLCALATLLFVVFLFWLCLRSSQDADAWERFERAQTLLRQRNAAHHHNSHHYHEEQEGNHNSKMNQKPAWPLNFGVSANDRTDSGSGTELLDVAALQAAKAVTDWKSLTLAELMDWFDRVRPKGTGGNAYDVRRQMREAAQDVLHPLLREWASRLDAQLISNAHSGTQWIRPYLLPPLHASLDPPELVALPGHNDGGSATEPVQLFKVRRGHANDDWAWQRDWQTLQERNAPEDLQPPVDYTNPKLYTYPALQATPPAAGGYPALQPLGELLQQWPQTDDVPKGHQIHETLLHFNYSDPSERAMAERFRNARLPFKVYDIPDITKVSQLWTDEYVHEQFDNTGSLFGNSGNKRADGVCQESTNHFFAFFVPPLWQAAVMGLPPVRNNDWTFEQWAQHARYADAAALSHDQPHVYWQAGAGKGERFEAAQSFISRDLQSTLGAPVDNFFVFNVKEQKGIQCRFGERGVTAATHYDAGQNMIAMLTGAKRYILSPPVACPHLGVFQTRESPIFRHSLLNFAHLNCLKDEDEDADGNDETTTSSSSSSSRMSPQERAWLQRAAQAPAVETVLKQGEVLFVPSFWFHYIVSLQKSAQCNVRSGIDQKGTKEFGNMQDISNRCGPEDGRQHNSGAWDQGAF